jgi:hypothetical protein
MLFLPGMRNLYRGGSVMILLLNHHPINILFLPGMRNLYRGGSVMILLYIEPPSYKHAVSVRYEEFI